MLLAGYEDGCANDHDVSVRQLLLSSEIHPRSPYYASLIVGVEIAFYSFYRYQFIFYDPLPYPNEQTTLRNSSSYGLSYL